LLNKFFDRKWNRDDQASSLLDNDRTSSGNSNDKNDLTIRTIKKLPQSGNTAQQHNLLIVYIVKSFPSVVPSQDNRARKTSSPLKRIFV